MVKAREPAMLFLQRAEVFTHLGDTELSPKTAGQRAVVAAAIEPGSTPSAASAAGASGRAG